MHSPEPKNAQLTELNQLLLGAYEDLKSTLTTKESALLALSKEVDDIRRKLQGLEHSLNLSPLAPAASANPTNPAASLSLKSILAAVPGLVVTSNDHRTKVSTPGGAVGEFLKPKASHEVRPDADPEVRFDHLDTEAEAKIRKTIQHPTNHPDSYRWVPIGREQLLVLAREHMDEGDARAMLPGGVLKLRRVALRLCFAAGRFARSPVRAPRSTAIFFAANPWLNDHNEELLKFAQEVYKAVTGEPLPVAALPKLPSEPRTEDLGTASEGTVTAARELAWMRASKSANFAAPDAEPADEAEVTPATAEADETDGDWRIHYATVAKLLPRRGGPTQAELNLLVAQAKGVSLEKVAARLPALMSKWAAKGKFRQTSRGGWTVAADA